jgi:hypothetical protein
METQQLVPGSNHCLRFATQDAEHVVDEVEPSATVARAAQRVLQDRRDVSRQDVWSIRIVDPTLLGVAVGLGQPLEKSLCHDGLVQAFRQVPRCAHSPELGTPEEAGGPSRGADVG